MGGIFRLHLFLSVVLWGLVVGCGRASDPVEQLSKDLERYPEYSIIVDDLRIEEGVFPDYFLRFKVLTASGQRIAGRDTLVYSDSQTDWYKVTRTIYARYENYVGMVVASKTLDGHRTDVHQAQPPGYAYVGNPRYGYWGGGGFWQFYGQYALMRDLLGGWRIGRGDYDRYRQHQERRTPYFGPVKNGRSTFGTQGTVTQKTRPTFYRRYTARRQAFARRARARMTTSRSNWGRRSFRGK